MKIIIKDYEFNFNYNKDCSEILTNYENKDTGTLITCTITKRKSQYIISNIFKYEGLATINRNSLIINSVWLDALKLFERKSKLEKLLK